MRRYLILIVCFVVSLLGLSAQNYMVNGYENTCPSTYNYTPFKSTSTVIQTTNYNNVKPLNADGSVSMDYTTYKGVYRPRRNNGGLWGDDHPDGPAIGELLTPIGDPIIPLLIIMFAYLSYRRIKIQR
jgi:hypothetical protein